MSTTAKPVTPDDFFLETSRLRMRPPTEGDVDGLWSHARNPAITEFLAWEPHADNSVTRSLIESLRKSQDAASGYHWLILLDDTIIGLVSLIDVRHRHLTWTMNRAELAYWVAPDFQRRGFAAEAAKAVVDFGFSSLGLEKIRVAHATENVASRIVSERLGFRKYATERRAYCKEGRWHDLIWYDLLRDEFLPWKDGKNK